MVNNSTFTIRPVFQGISRFVPLGRLLLSGMMLVVLAAAPAGAVTEKLYPVLPGAVIELCRPGEEENACLESPNLRMRYRSSATQQQVLAELLAASKRRGWRMYPLRELPGRYQSANQKREWELLWELQPAPADDEGPGYYVYYWKIPIR